MLPDKEPTRPQQARSYAPDITQPATAHTPEPLWQPRRRRVPWPAVLLGVVVGAVVGISLLVPFRTNVLLIGIDRPPEGTAAGRSDTLMLWTFQPWKPYVGVLSIPRDLWVSVPGIGENRINTAHYFAEVNQPGSGLAATKLVVRENFGVDVHYAIRFQFEGLVDAVDALGGIELELPQPMSGYTAGRHRLDGTAALAFVRDRAGSDDFARMARGQLFLRAVFGQLLAPANWPRAPLAAARALGSIQSDLPIWEWPRLAFGLLRAGPEGIDARVIDRTMAVGFTTSDGAQVLAPQWDRINAVLMEMFGQ